MEDIKNSYDEFITVFDGNEEVDNLNYHFAYQKLIEAIAFSTGKQFDDFASQDTSYELPPWIWLIGYRHAALEEPRNLDFQKKYLVTLQLYYSFETEGEIIEELKVRIKALEQDRDV